jgi:hypothetical protein
MFPLDALLGIGSKLIDKFFPDPAAADAARAQLLQIIDKKGTRPYI